MLIKGTISDHQKIVLDNILKIGRVVNIFVVEKDSMIKIGSHRQSWVAIFWLDHPIHQTTLHYILNNTTYKTALYIRQYIWDNNTHHTTLHYTRDNTYTTKSTTHKTMLHTKQLHTRQRSTQWNTTHHAILATRQHCIPDNTPYQKTLHKRQHNITDNAKRQTLLTTKQL